MRSDTPLGILAATLLVAGIAVREEPPTAQDALWSVDAEQGVDAPAGKGLPSDFVPDELLLARWSAAAGLAPDEAHEPKYGETLDSVAEVDMLEPR